LCLSNVHGLKQQALAHFKEYNDGRKTWLVSLREY